MLTGSACPEKLELRRLMLGEVSEQDTEALAEHLRVCARCAETVRNLQSGDTLADALRGGHDGIADAADSDRVSELIERLRLLRPAMADAGLAGTLPDASGPTSEPFDAPSQETSECGQPTQDVWSFLAPAEQPGEIGRLGPYRVLSLIGEGGMGVVFEAEDPALGRRVALKVMNPKLAENEADRRRFLREARATAAIEHDHIVPIYQVGEDRGVPYLAMQLLRGETLEARLARQRRLPVPDALRIGREIAAGLAAAHARGLIHRDIKPANVFLETRGHSSGFRVQESTSISVLNPEPQTLHSRVKLLDFGLARVQQDESGISQTNTIAGTPAYMAPEQAQGRAVDRRADLFSLGCVLYRALTGDPPFHGANAFAVLVEVTGRDPKPLRQVNADIPPELESLVMKLLAKDPATRHQSAVEVADAIADIEKRAAARDERGKSPPPARTRRWASAVAAVTVVVLAIIATIVGSQIIRVKTPHGTIVLELDSPDADGAAVFVDEQHKVTIQLHGESEPLAINVDAGTHRLRVVKAGFEVFTRDLSLNAGRREQIRVRLEPAGEKTAASDVVPERGPSTSQTPKSGTKPAPAVARAGSNAAVAIPGLAPRPAAVPGFRRWQYETRLPRGTIRSLAWDPDGRRIACGSMSGIVRVFDPDTAELLQVIPAHRGTVLAIDWGRDGQRIASGGEDGVARLHDMSGGPQRDLDRHSNRVMTVAFSPDNSWVALAGWDSAVRLCRTTGELGPWLEGHAVQTNAVAWHPNGERLASGSWDGTVRIWNTSGSAGPVLKGHEGGVLGLAWSPDGELLASAGVDGTIRIWTSDGAERFVWRGGGSRAVHAVAWSTADMLATGGADGTVRLWQRDGTLLTTHPLDLGGITALAWTRDGSRLAVATEDGPVRFLDDAGEPTGALSHDAAAVLSIAWSRAGLLATAGHDTTVRVWNDDGTQKSLFKGHTKKAWRVSWDPAGTRLVSGGADGAVRVWDLSGETIETRRGFHPVAWNPAGDDIAWGIGFEVRMAAPGGELRVLRGHKAIVGWMNWNSDGTQLASCGMDGEVRLWGRDGSPGPVMQFQGLMNSLAWHPKRPLFAVAVSDGGNRSIQLWHASGTLSDTWQSNVHGTQALAWSPDGERLLAAAGDATMQLWTADGKPAGSFPAAPAAAAAATWDPSGRRIATSHTDGTIRAWDSNSLEPQWTSLLFNDGHWVRFDPSGSPTASDSSLIDRRLVVVAEDDRGSVQLLKPSEFRERQRP